MSFLGDAMAATIAETKLNEELIAFSELFERSVEQWPNEEAVVFDGNALTYAELNAYANRMAHSLIAKGVGTEDRIGLCLDRSHHAIAAMIGVMKSGAAFVPLDPEFPADRLSYMVQDAGIEIVISESQYGGLFENVLLMDLAADLEGIDDDSNPKLEIQPEQLAYIMYTSGSTGNPKGVQIEHRGLATYCFADIDIYDVVASDRTLQFSTINFDIAIEEIFPPLLVGSCVVVRPSTRSADQNELSSIIESNGVTAVHIATAYWHEWVDLMRATGQRVPESIRLMVVTGEKVSTEHVRRWHELCDRDVLWCNAYGPTEATVSATVFIPPSGWDGDNMPIGKPLKRYTGHILDTDGKPVGSGETGELFIGGPALARGYLNRPDLTAAAFATIEIDGKLTRLYKSGDLARWLPDGDIEFAGRIDHQIKLGSYRVEPGEIEAAVNTHPDVLESLVSYDEIEGQKFLVAYVASGDAKLELEGLDEHLRENLPPYMVPTRFVVLDRFPKTINGKVDRRALPDPAESQIARSGGCDAAETELQTEMVRIWRDVLNVPNVGIHDDFFALGGSSLLVTRVIMQIQSRLETEIPVRDFFANPTVASICTHIERLANGTASFSDDAVDAERAASVAWRKTLPAIEPAFVPSGDERLFAVYYPPVEGSGKTNATTKAVLLCNAYGHEYQRSYRNLQQLAVALSKAGMHVLRFDFSGTGNSTGAIQGASTSQWKDDILAAAEYLKQVSGQTSLSVLGVRFGATLAANAELSDVDELILWDPVDGDDMCRQLESFHELSLRDFSRFDRAYRQAEPGQYYGHAMSHEQRMNISLTHLPFDPVKAQSVTVINSRECQPSLTHKTWDIIQTSDEIFWDSPDYTESAFSSRAIYESIFATLTKGKTS